MNGLLEIGNPLYIIGYSTVTLFAKFLGWSTSRPLLVARWYANICNGKTEITGESIQGVFGIHITSSDIEETNSSPMVATAITFAFLAFAHAKDHLG